MEQVGVGVMDVGYVPNRIMERRIGRTAVR